MLNAAFNDIKRPELLSMYIVVVSRSKFDVELGLLFIRNRD